MRLCRKDMPKKSQIREYWAKTLIEDYERDHPKYYENQKMFSNQYKSFIKIMPGFGETEEEYCLSQHLQLWREKEDFCFACLWSAVTFRCHIQPLCEGGSNDASNLHLLCQHCHFASESLSGELYWHWFDATNFMNCGFYTSKLPLVQKMFDDPKFVDEYFKNNPNLAAKTHEIIKKGKETYHNMYSS